MKNKKRADVLTDEEYIELFNQSGTIQEKLQFFSKIQDYTSQIELLESIPSNEKHKFIGKIKSPNGIDIALNSLESETSKTKTFNFVVKQMKGNSKMLLDILQGIDFKVTLPENMLLLKINNLNDIDIDKMIKIKDNVENSSQIQFKVNENESEDVIYTFAELSAITAKITELTAGIPDELSQSDKFYTIYTRIINNITYDNKPIYETRKQDTLLQEKLSGGYLSRPERREIVKDYKDKVKEIRRDCAGMYGGLIEGKAICIGYATILHEALKKVGLKSMIITGTSIEDIRQYKSIISGHAWNQVQIDGKWYNADSTSDASTCQRTGNICCMLRADNHFNPHAEYTRDTENAHVCKEDYPFEREHFMNIFNRNRWWRGLGGGR